MEIENSLNQLKNFSVIVADTGDIKLIKQLVPKDATTNPSLLVKASEQSEYQYLIDDAINYAVGKLDTKDSNNRELVDLILDRLYVNFGKEIL
jgi:transaldolase